MREIIVYIPPVALMVSCLWAIVCPLWIARMVTCHVPPESRSPAPSYIPFPVPFALITVFIAAIPIAGIAAIKNVTVTFAPTLGLPSCVVSFTHSISSAFRIDYCFHRRHSHCWHRRHKKCHSDICSDDRLAVLCGQLHSDEVVTLVWRIRIGSELDINLRLFG